MWTEGGETETGRSMIEDRGQKKEGKGTEKEEERGKKSKGYSDGNSARYRPRNRYDQISRLGKRQKY